MTRSLGVRRNLHHGLVAVRHSLSRRGHRHRRTVAGRVMPHGDVLRIIDAEAKRSFGVSGDAFLESLEQGQARDEPASAYLSILAGPRRR